MMLIGVSGYAQAGKDTFADTLVRHYGFVKRSFADPIRQAMELLNPIVDGMHSSGLRYSEAVETFGYNAAKDMYPEIRVLLQRLGTEVGREIIGPHVWIDALFRSRPISERTVITDVRFPNEAEAIWFYGGHMVRVTRPSVGRVNDHPSEDQDFKVDTIVHNDSTLYDLSMSAHTLMRELTIDTFVY
jgi:hypothetical protein